MKIVMVGAGAIGRFFGGMLSKSKHEVIFLDTNPEVVGAVNEKGIQFLKLGEKKTDVYFTAKARATGEGHSIDFCDLIILSVKGYTTAAALRSVAHLVRQESPVLTIQTGLGNIETMGEIVDKQNILGGVTFHGATSLDESKVWHAGSGKTLIGELEGERTERLIKIKEAFDRSDIQTEVSNNVVGHVWSKALVYSAINALTAILRLRNGQVIEKMESIALAKRLIDEGKLVAQACAVQLPHEDLYDKLLEVCRNTAENLSPMLQDILNGRPTEIETLSGMIYSMGKRKGVATPLHQALTDMVKLLEKWGVGREL
ncbi:MAG: 2-dehydropantoate 2-reductase [Deltaproteobacteria bacterium]